MREVAPENGAVASTSGAIPSALATRRPFEAKAALKVRGLAFEGERLVDRRGRGGQAGRPAGLLLVGVFCGTNARPLPYRCPVSRASRSARPAAAPPPRTPKTYSWSIWSRSPGTGISIAIPAATALGKSAIHRMRRGNWIGRPSTLFRPAISLAVVSRPVTSGRTTGGPTCTTTRALGAVTDHHPAVGEHRRGGHERVGRVLGDHRREDRGDAGGQRGGVGRGESAGDPGGALRAEDTGQGLPGGEMGGVGGCGGVRGPEPLSGLLFRRGQGRIVGGLGEWFRPDP